MRVFIAGASGYIGSQVAKAFRAKGHSVYGLVRSEEDAHLLSLEEIWPVKGDLAKPESYQHILSDVEVAVLCAFDASSAKGVEQDAQTIETILEAFSKSNLPRTFIYTSGVWVYGSRGEQVVDEAMPLQPLEIVKWRPAHEDRILKATTPLLRTVIMRPGHVYGKMGGLAQLFFHSALNGTLSIIGNGNNHWPMVHVQDLACAYVLAAEKELTHVILNVVDDANPTLREIVEAIARSAKLEGTIPTLPEEEAVQKLGSVAQGYLIDLKVDNSRIKHLLDWKIDHASFIDDTEIYYHAWQAYQRVEEF